jgi:hydroxyacylglutathione hydrolase
MELNIKTFSFNPFALNTYVLSNAAGNAIIIDAGNSDNDENQALLAYIKENKLNVEGLYLTHAHIDHILGAKFLSEHFGLGVHYHPAGSFLFDVAEASAQSLGFQFSGLPSHLIPLKEGDEVMLGDENGKVLYTPGHVDGSLCFYFPKSKLVIVGDVLFHQGIGRTDLPTGNYEVLEQSIRQKLYTLPEDTQVFPGHGPSTSIGFEKKNNPFFQG